MLNVNFIRLKDSFIEERIYYQPKYTNSWVICDIILKSNDYEWKLIGNGHTVDGPVIADIPEILHQGNILVLNIFYQKLQFAKVIQTTQIFWRDALKLKPFPGLSKEWLALVESSLMKSDWWNETLIILDIQTVSLLLPNQKYVQNVGNYRKIYFPSRVNHPEKHNIITDSSKVNVRYLSIEELQSKLEMAQKNPTESVRRLIYLSIKASKILNTEGIQVSKDHDLELKEIIANSDNPFNKQTPMRLLWQ